MSPHPIYRVIELEYVWRSQTYHLTAAYHEPGLDGPARCELLDAIDEWGFDRLDELPLHVLEDATLQALASLDDDS